MKFKYNILGIIYFLILCNISCNSSKLNLEKFEMPEEYIKYKDINSTIFQIVQVTGTIKEVILKEAELTAKNLITARIESKIESLSELSQENKNNKFSISYKSLSKSKTSFKIGKVELVNTKYYYNKKSKKYILWAVFKINDKELISLLN